MLDLTGSNAKGERTESAVCGRMAVTTHDRGSGQSEALLWPNNVDDSLSVIVEAKKCQVEVADIVVKGSTLRPRIGLFDEALDVFVGLAGCRGDVLFRQSWLVFVSKAVAPRRGYCTEHVRDQSLPECSLAA